jgi:hypothetical protein
MINSLKSCSFSKIKEKCCSSKAVYALSWDKNSFNLVNIPVENLKIFTKKMSAKS